MSVTGMFWLQTVLSTPASTKGKVSTLICIVVESIQPKALVPTMVYEVVATGKALTLVPEGELNEAAGDQENRVAWKGLLLEDTESAMVSLKQMVSFPLVKRLGS